MPRGLGAPSSSRVLRWTSFIVVQVNVAFMYVFINAAGALPSITEASKQHATTFAPADYVNAIYWIIGAAVLLFFVAALWPRHRRTRLYDPFVVPLAILSTLASAWVVALRFDQVGVAVALTVAGVVLGARMFARAAASPSQGSQWLRVPFALIFGWTTVALLASTAQCFIARGWLSTSEAIPVMSLALLAIAAAIGALVALRYREFVFPMVVAWAMSGIYVGQRAFDPAVARAARAVCLGLLIVAGIAAVAAAIELFRRKEHQMASRRAEQRKPANLVGPTAKGNPARAGRWPTLHAPSRAVVGPQHRDYLLDLDAATTRS